MQRNNPQQSTSQNAEFGPFITKLYQTSSPPFPVAPRNSQISKHIQPLLDNNTHGGTLSWTQVRIKLEAIFGRGSIDLNALQVGSYGLVLVAAAFQRLDQIVVEGEFIEAEMWTISLSNAIDTFYKNSVLNSIKTGDVSAEQMVSAAMSDEELAASILVTNPNSNSNPSPQSASAPAPSSKAAGKKRSLPAESDVDLAALNSLLDSSYTLPDFSTDAYAIPSGSGSNDTNGIHPDLLAHDSPASAEPPNKKRGRPSGTGATTKSGPRLRRTSPGPNRPRAAAPRVYTLRTFPAHIPILQGFMRMYRQFYISSALAPDAGLSAPGLMTLDRLRAGWTGSRGGGYTGNESTPILPPTSTTSNQTRLELQQMPGMEDFDLSFLDEVTIPVHPSLLPSASNGNNIEVGQPVASGSGIQHQNGNDDSTTPQNGVDVKPEPNPTWNVIPNLLDLYVPRFVKGVRDDKEGVCPICIEPPERGGEGEVKWLNLRNSSFVYHMSYYHGISKATGLPFSPPKDQRLVDVEKKAKHGRDKMLEGQCHHCNKWIALQSLKSLEAVVPEIFWWKHAKSCHGINRIEGEGNEYVQDEIYNLVAEKKRVAGLPNSAGDLNVNGGVY